MLWRVSHQHCRLIAHSAPPCRDVNASTDPVQNHSGLRTSHANPTFHGPRLQEHILVASDACKTSQRRQQQQGGQKNHDLTAHHLIPKGHRSCACRKAPPPPCMLLLLSEEHRERLRCNSASASQHVSDWPCAALPDRPGGKASSTRGTGQSGASDQQAPVACLRRRVRPPSAGRRVALRRNCNVRMLAAGARWSAGPWANGRAERGSLAALHAAPAPAPDGGVGRRWAQAEQPRAGRRCCCCAAVFWPAPWISAVRDRRCCSRGDRAPWCGGAVWVKAVRDAAGPGVRLLCCARNSGVLSVGDGWVDGCGVAGWGYGVPPPDLPRFHHTAAQSQRMGPARLVSPSSFTRGISSTCS